MLQYEYNNIHTLPSLRSAQYGAILKEHYPMFKNIGSSVTFAATQVIKVAAITDTITTSINTACLFAEYTLAEALESEMTSKGWTMDKLKQHRKMLASLSDI